MHAKIAATILMSSLSSVSTRAPSLRRRPARTGRQMRASWRHSRIDFIASRKTGRRRVPIHSPPKLLHCDLNDVDRHAARACLLGPLRLSGKQAKDVERPTPTMSQLSQVKAEAASSSAAPSPASTEDSKPSYAEYQLFSSPDPGHRFNIMKMNSLKAADPSRFPQPVTMMRKDPNGGLDDRFAYDEKGNVLGRWDFDDLGKPILGADGKQTYTPDRVEADQSLVAPGEGGKPVRKRYQKTTKEIHQVDKEVMRFKREEAHPWVLEAGDQSKEQSEKWIGRIQDTSDQAYVMFVLDEGSESFRVMPVGRKYKFEPNRTFNVLDADQADAAVSCSTDNKFTNRKVPTLDEKQDSRPVVTARCYRGPERNSQG